MSTLTSLRKPIACRRGAIRGGLKISMKSSRGTLFGIKPGIPPVSLADQSVRMWVESMLSRFVARVFPMPVSFTILLSFTVLLAIGLRTRRPFIVRQAGRVGRVGNSLSRSASSSPGRVANSSSCGRLSWTLATTNPSSSSGRQGTAHCSVEASLDTLSSGRGIT